MNTLIEELKNDHAEIVKVLTKVRELGIGSKDGQDTLLAAKEGLLAHLKKEDERLYPSLRKAAENTPGLKYTLDMFAKDMAPVSKNAIDFFGKYAKGGANIEFAKDFGGLVGALGTRIQKEEKILYPEYEKLMR
ncbi:MAG: hypothetical protein A3J51_02645 [Omnitrophica WOR_2 bacterium RIFCSPHIGHO2_02_FULL_45_21]|nr:MAG: hypothetical protein A3J51_02645 [Omnitrophica WOR_2 bacterium RIFCSPHIGHO2_02_FULL_45_21]